MQRLLAPREAAHILGISYPTLKQWIYRGKLKTAKTPGGHHRVPESEIDRLIAAGTLVRDGATVATHDSDDGPISVTITGLASDLTNFNGGTYTAATGTWTGDAAKEMRLKPGERVAALVKSTEVMILRV